MPVEARELTLSRIHRNGNHQGSEIFDPQDEPLQRSFPGEDVEDFQSIAPHEHSEFSPIMRYDPARVADHILKNGRHP